MEKFVFNPESPSLASIDSGNLRVTEHGDKLVIWLASTTYPGTWEPLVCGLFDNTKRGLQRACAMLDLLREKNALPGSSVVVPTSTIEKYEQPELCIVSQLEGGQLPTLQKF